MIKTCQCSMILSNIKQKNICTVKLNGAEKEQNFNFAHACKGGLKSSE
jgi:hypothetical protein